MSNKNNRFPLEKNDVSVLLKEHGITPTRQRLEIAHYLFQKQQHISAEHILDQVNALGASVSRATVYNTMGLFARKGLVREVLIDRERVFYDSNSIPHYHIYNMDTGELSDLEGSTGASIGAVDISNLPPDVRVVDTDVVIKVTQR
ncbi:MAG: transcriptional repressor [Gammaproteobacteria bacterium]|nr:transcriptional repressor [Gammaproteobacteria bacterium]MCW8924495.1 transcriptional repressor [Gammaproteobacteria bacterium]